MASISTATDFLQSIRRVSTDHCQVCETPTTKKCGKCKTAIYCSTQCQHSDWNAHRAICKAQDKHSRIQSKIDFLSQKILEIESATSDTRTDSVNLHIAGYL